MNPSRLRLHRATTDDFGRLQALWQSMHFPSAELEKRLTEFQVVETADGNVAGAIGLQIIGPHARLHSEGYTDFSVADAARELFWERIQTIASHHGVLRLWTQETSPFWPRWGFQSPSAEALDRLPAEWRQTEAPWLTLQLKDEAAVAAMDKELETFRASGKKRMQDTLDQARSMTNTLTTILLILAAICLGIAAVMFIHRISAGPLR